jgi:putative membrane protein
MLARGIPYCGTPPTPDGLLGRWNLDPLLILVLAAVWIGYGLYAARRVSPGRQCAFHAGWGLTALFLICPLCPLSVSLFSARVGQHMLLTMVAAPLVALGLPDGPQRRWSNPILAAAAFALALWFWHAPVPYDATFQSTPVYWAMHLTLYGSALWLWRGLLIRPGERLAQAIGAGALTAGQMGLLAAAITFAGRPLYAPHALTTWAWGMTPLGDQELGGAVMWAPAGAILAGALVFGLATAMRRAARADLAAPLTGGA